MKLFALVLLECYSAIKRNTLESVLRRWMNLKSIIQSEVNQKEKDKYCVLTHIYMEFRKMLLTFKTEKETQIQTTDFWTQ